MTSTSAPGPLEAPTPITLTARSPEDLLALAPVVLGFFPVDSVVMLTFGGVSAFHARIDLPGSPEEISEAVDLLVAPACRHGVERVVLLLYSEDPLRTGHVRQVWHALRGGFESAGIAIVEALGVAAGRWHCLSSPSLHLDDRGVAFDITSHPFVVAAVVDGRVVHGSREALAATLATDSEAVSRIRRLTARSSLPVDLLAEGTWVACTIARDLRHDPTADPAHPRLPDDERLARVLVALSDLRLRDAAWSVVTRETSRAAVSWWTHALIRSPQDLAAAPAALLAWSAWLHGNGALAWCALDRCELAEPGYGLAQIVSDLLEQAHPPTSWSESVDWRSGLDGASWAG